MIPVHATQLYESIGCLILLRELNIYGFQTKPV